MNKKTLMACMTITIILISRIIFLLFTGNEDDAFIEQREDLIDVIYKNVMLNNKINFSELIEDEWDEMFIITSYEDPKVAFEKEGLKWEKIDTSIEIRDDISLLVFLNDGKIVLYVNYPRLNGDFRESGIFKRHSTEFKVEKASAEEWIYLNHIGELSGNAR